MGLFDSFKKNKEVQEPAPVQTPTPVAQPAVSNVAFDEERMMAEKKAESLQATQPVAPVVSQTISSKEDVEVLDPGVDLSKVGLCKNCGQKIVPGSTICLLCGKPVK